MQPGPEAATSMFGIRIIDLHQISQVGPGITQCVFAYCNLYLVAVKIFQSQNEIEPILFVAYKVTGGIFQGYVGEAHPGNQAMFGH